MTNISVEQLLFIPSPLYTHPPPTSSIKTIVFFHAIRMFLKLSESFFFQSDGLIFYSGPDSAPADGRPGDYIALEMYGGYPVLTIDHGTGSVPLQLNGKNKNGEDIMAALNDGKWHKIDIIRKGKVCAEILNE